MKNDLPDYFKFLGFKNNLTIAILLWDMDMERILMPITHEKYAKIMIAMKEKSNYHSVNYNAVMQPIVEKYGGKSIDVMSIGPGSGFVEDKIMKHPDLSINSTLLVEPNPVFAEELKVKSAKWGDTVSEIDISYFDEHYETSKRFDVIIIMHAIVYVENAVNAIKKVKSFLKDGGQIMIGIRGQNSGCQLVSRMHEYMKMDGSKSSYASSLNGISLADSLRKHCILYQIQESTAVYDFTDFIEKKKTPSVYDLISVFLYTSYDNLESDLQDELYKMVKERAITTEDDRKVLHVSHCYITIENA